MGQHYSLAMVPKSVAIIGIFFVMSFTQVVPEAHAVVPVMCDLEPQELGVALGVDIIVVSDTGDGDSRLPASLVQLGCTWEQYDRLFPEPPAEADVQNGVAGYELLEYLIMNPGEMTEFATLVASGKYVPVTGGATETELLAVQNSCLAEDCSRMEPECFHPSECTEEECTFDCELVAPCTPDLLECVPPVPCTPDPLECVPPVPCTPDPLECVPPVPCTPDPFECLPPLPCTDPLDLVCALILVVDLVCGSDGDCTQPCPVGFACTLIEFVTECAADEECVANLVCTVDNPVCFCLFGGGCTESPPPVSLEPTSGPTR